MKNYRIAAAILATTALCSPAFAVETDSDTGTIAVSLTVVDDCVLETNPLSFPTSGIIDEDVTTTATITIECTRDSAYEIGLSAGANAGGTDIDERKLKLSGGASDDVLSYQLYSDGGFASPWGHTIGDDTVAAASATGADETYTIHALIPDHQNAPAGSYSDTITATIWYGGALD
jgi:spore coat protein U-like protein